MFIWDFAANPIMDALLDWFYSQLVGFLGAFFAQMGNMGVELFDLDWVGSSPDFIAVTFRNLVQTDDNYNLFRSLMENSEWRQRFKDIVREMEKNAFYMESIEGVFAKEEAKILDEIAYDFQSAAFSTSGSKR